MKSLNDRVRLQAKGESKSNVITHQTAKLNNLGFHPLEVESCYRDPQLKVGENPLVIFVIL